MLPKQNIIRYELTIPSTGKVVKFRPFTVREEKSLLIANQSENLQTMVETLKAVITECVEGVEVEKLATFDLEFIMVSIRAKSVGENVRLEFECEADSSHPAIIMDLDLTKMSVKTDPIHTKKIPLFDDVGVVMKYPDISMMETMVDIESNPLEVFEMIKKCIDYIYDSEEVFHAKDQTAAEIEEFVEGLTKEQFDRIGKFFTTMPKFVHEVDYICPTCGHEHHKKIEGFSSFF